MKKANKLILATVLALALPTGALATEADLQVKIDTLSKQMEELKGQVERVQDKSLSKWLQIGGSYQFRMDSLYGKTAAYSSALDTMQVMVGDFLSGPNAASISGTNGFAAYAMEQSKTGALFTPEQFSMIVGTYMPNAMYGAFTNTAFLNNLMGAVFAGPPAVTSALDNMPLSAQQNAVLNNMISMGVLNTVMGMPASANIAWPAAMGGGQVAGATLGEQWTTMMTALGGMGYDTAQVQALANTMLMQGFLGDPAIYGTSYLQKVAAYKPKNETMYTNKFSLDLKAKAAKDVTVNVKLGMYKVFGAQDSDAITGQGYFMDRVGIFDGVLGHVPSTSYLNVDRAYATWSNIMEQPVWFSVGRRPATDGAPLNLKSNTERPGNGGTPALLVNYAFDGMTLGYAPDIDMLPGFYAKVCYGRGNDSGFRTSSNSVKDTDMLGVAVIPVDTDPLRIWLQWNRGFNIFDAPSMKNTAFGNWAPAENLGDMDWYGAGAMTTLKKVGPGNLNAFADFGLSVSHPNNKSNIMGLGLMSGQFFAPETSQKSQTGYAAFAGIRYDLPSKTKIGFEYNYGSKYWMPFSPSADDMWTSKVGTRGQVFEPYIIQELDLKPVSSYFAKAFFKLGYQYYDFQYTGSNSWVGEPVKIADIKPTDLLLQAPVKEAHDIYGTFEVHF